MNSKFLHFLCVLACAALIGLGPARAQKLTGSNPNGSAVTAPARQPDASHSTVAPASATRDNAASAASQRAANRAIANDRGTTGPNRAGSSTFNVGWIGLAGLLGLLGLVRRNRAETTRRADVDRDRSDFPRAA